ncbi:Lrp/AsnC family transcriptional regulator [Vibrio sp. SCSIO 43136]|uniref:Lrp/AsnC family transcriptional regulator n=1 Tax=Vibrio sp. SCSIO 43136 TaxID=2819101 RepID=UPI0020757BB6|nr:Lrp/AsnC family transcriptional regulator [Vibrio sp. SCSIO 43136]USD64681.1 Lrp/AsnC family transcriptional regulator [Vibrio sp. SCSIO 43136]
MDRYDERILRELTKDGRISNVELAQRIGLSASATLRRVQELEKNGVITGYRAVLDPQKMGVGFVAYVTIGLSNHSKHSQLDFENRVFDAEQVVECHNITGGSEYLLRVETQDLKSYKQFHSKVLGEIPQVNAITTLVVMGSPKDSRV